MIRRLSITATILTTALILGGCASTTEYGTYAQGQAHIETARYAAEAAKYKAMADIAASGDATAKVAAMFALAMGGNGPGAGGHGASTQLKAPEAPGQSILQWASVLVPALTQGYGIYSNTKLGMTNSNNAARIAESTNSTFLGIAGKIQSPAANVTTTTTTTLSGTGVIGSGSYATNANPTTTLSGTGVIGSGTYAPEANPVTTLSGTGTMGSGSYTPAPVVVTPVVTNPVVQVTPVVTNPVVITPVVPVVPVVVAP